MHENDNDPEEKGKDLINHDEGREVEPLPGEPGQNIVKQESDGEDVKQVDPLGPQSETVLQQPQTCLPNRQASLSAEAAAQSGNIEPQTKDMEVHHKHHHDLPGHKEKLWKHYLFEFLMLFLAVTAGFFVENQREHYVEHKRAKEFARLLIDDLVADTFELNKAQKVWQNIVIASDSLSSLLQAKNTKIPGGKLYYYEYWSGWRWSVISRDATLQQLKNSGALRYMGDVLMIRKILNYEEAIKVIYLLQNKYEPEKTENWNLVQKVFDQSVFDTLETIKGAARDSVNVFNAPDPLLTAFLNKDYPLNTYDQTVLRELRNWAGNTSRNYRILIKDIAHTKQTAIEAIEALKKEYQLD